LLTGQYYGDFAEFGFELAKFYISKYIAHTLITSRATKKQTSSEFSKEEKVTINFHRFY